MITWPPGRSPTRARGPRCARSCASSRGNPDTRRTPALTPQPGGARDLSSPHLSISVGAALVRGKLGACAAGPVPDRRDAGRTGLAVSAARSRAAGPGPGRIGGIAPATLERRLSSARSTPAGPAHRAPRVAHAARQPSRRSNGLGRRQPSPAREGLAHGPESGKARPPSPVDRGRALVRPGLSVVAANLRMSEQLTLVAARGVEDVLGEHLGRPTVPHIALNSLPERSNSGLAPG